MGWVAATSEWKVPSGPGMYLASELGGREVPRGCPVVLGDYNCLTRYNGFCGDSPVTNHVIKGIKSC